MQAAVFHRTVYNSSSPSPILPAPYDECLMHFELDFTSCPDAGRSACFRAALKLLISFVVAKGDFGLAVLFYHCTRFYQTVYFFSIIVEKFKGVKFNI